MGKIQEVGFIPLTTDQANADFCAYYADAPVYTNKIKGIVINGDQFNAMKELDTFFAENGIICTGYRIYHGINTLDSPNPISILVGIDQLGKDICDHNGMSCIKGCDARTWGNCPDVCDGESPITQEDGE